MKQTQEAKQEKLQETINTLSLLSTMRTRVNLTPSLVRAMGIIMSASQFMLPSERRASIQ